MRNDRSTILLFPLCLVLAVAPGCASKSTETPASPTAAAPKAPTGLTAVGTTGSLTDMVFTDNSDNETGFRVYVDGSQYRTLGPDVASFQIGPPCGSTYQVAVTAFNPAGESASSNAVNVAGYCAPATVPAPPSNLVKVDYTATYLANMKFKDNSNNEAGFRVYDNGSLIMTLGPNERTFQLNPMHGTINTSVTAFNTAGESTATNTVTVPTDCSDCHH